MKQITLAISEAKSVQSSQWNHCIYETWWDNNCCQKWRFIVKYGTHLAEKGGGKWLHEVSQGMMQLARLLLYLREKSSTRTSAMGLEHFIKPEHFDLIIASVKSLCSFDHWENKCYCSWAIPEGIVLPYWLKKISDKRTDCPPDQSVKYREAHCFWMD